MLLLGIGVGVLLRLESISNNKFIEFDEAITYLAATGHQGEYALVWDELREPAQTWASVADWQRFIKIEDRFVYSRIAEDLGQYDFHPPLHYWMLHTWGVLFGINHFQTGPLINLFLDILIAGGLFYFARLLFERNDLALFVSAYWLLSPTAIATSLIARHYTLFTLFALFFAIQLYRITYRKITKTSTRDWLLLGFTVVGGLLSHYYFPFMILMGILLVILKHRLNNWHLIRKLTMFIVLSLVIALLLNPYTLDPYLNYASSLDYVQSQTDTVTDRLNEVWFQAKLPWSNHDGWQVLIFDINEQAPPESPIIQDNGFDILQKFYIVFFGGLGLLLLYRLARSLPQLNIKHLLSSKNHLETYSKHIFLFGMLISTLGVTLIFYLLRIAPNHAMNARYLSSGWVFLVFFIVICFAYKQPRTQWILIVFFLLQLIPQLFFLNFQLTHQRQQTTQIPHDYLIIDHTSRGELLQVIAELDSSLQVLVGSVDGLIDSFDNWSPQIDNQLVTYIQITGIGKTTQRDFITFFEEQGVIVEPTEPIFYSHRYLMFTLDFSETSSS